jgi:hypothetical protein
LNIVLPALADMGATPFEASPINVVRSSFDSQKGSNDASLNLMRSVRQMPYWHGMAGFVHHAAAKGRRSLW